MKFERGRYYLYYGHQLLRYNSANLSTGYYKFYDPSKKELVVLNFLGVAYLSPTSKLDLLLRGLDENIRIPRSKTASTGKR